MKRINEFVDRSFEKIEVKMEKPPSRNIMEKVDKFEQKREVSFNVFFLIPLLWFFSRMLLEGSNQCCGHQLGRRRMNGDIDINGGSMKVC